MNTEDSSHDMCIWINDEEEFNTEWSRLQGPVSVCSPPPPIRTQPAYSILFFLVFSPLCLSSVLSPLSMPSRSRHTVGAEVPGVGLPRSGGLHLLDRPMSRAHSLLDGLHLPGRPRRRAHGLLTPSHFRASRQLALFHLQ